MKEKKEWIVAVSNRVSFKVKRKKYSGTIVAINGEGASLPISDWCVVKLDKPAMKEFPNIEILKSELKKITNKYNVSKKEDRTHNGKVYPSTLEMDYRIWLETQRNKEDLSKRVVEVVEQVSYDCYVKGFKICSYLLDFEILYADDSVRCVDTKGKRTASYIIKKKLVEAIFDVKIEEVYRGDF